MQDIPGKAPQESQFIGIRTHLRELGIDPDCPLEFLREDETEMEDSGDDSERY